MKRVFFLIVLVPGLIALNMAALSRQAGPAVAITHVNVIDATGAPLQAEMTVVVVGDRIVSLGKTGQISVPANARVVVGRGKYLIPGLWDMHVHMVFGNWIPGGREVALPSFVANGITGVRDMGGDLKIERGWRDEINAGTLIGPRLILAGPMLDGPKTGFPSSLAIGTPEEGRRAVDDLKAQGADFIKVQSYIPRDAYFAVADEAKKQGITFVGHVPDVIRASEASDAGQKSIEHLTGIFEGSSLAEDEFLKGKRGPKLYLDSYNEARNAELIKRMARNHTWLVPTLVWERGQWLVDDIDYSSDPLLKYAPISWREKSWPRFKQGIMRDLDTDPVSVRRVFVQKEFDIVGAMHKAGVRVMAGTDTAAAIDVLPGFSLHQELECLVKAGFTPMEALQAATRDPAEFLGLQSLGTVEKGKLADLVLLDQNPLADIRNTTKISAVILNGRLLTRPDLDKLLNQIAAYASHN